ncbi:MAG: spore maturation protein A [Ruminococcus sp.]|nr:spore maturation protein A [Ruminococcus sp.]
MLSFIFTFMIVASIVCAMFTGKTEELSQSMMDGCADAVELLIMMSGMMCLWSGVMEVAKECRLTEKLAKLFSPVLSLIFPDIPKSSKAFELMSMNVSANLLGLGNAATPLGLQAMRELKRDSVSDVATDAMVNFVVMNTASIQLLPTTIATMRGALGSKSPFDIIFCVWISSVVALFMGLLVSKFLCIVGRIKWNL